MDDSLAMRIVKREGVDSVTARRRVTSFGETVQRALGSANVIRIPALGIFYVESIQGRDVACDLKFRASIQARRALAENTDFLFPQSSGYKLYAEFNQLFGMSAFEAGTVVRSVVEAFKECLMSSGSRVSWEGLGEFVLTVFQKLEGANPKTGDAIIIPAKSKLKFSAAQKARETIAAYRSQKKR